jgi:hypothetical protein
VRVGVEAGRRQGGGDLREAGAGGLAVGLRDQRVDTLADVLGAVLGHRGLPVRDDVERGVEAHDQPVLGGQDGGQHRVAVLAPEARHHIVGAHRALAYEGRDLGATTRCT